MTTSKTMRPDQPELHSPRGLRSPSSASDILSASGRSLLGNLPATAPRPLFIAQSAAEALVSAELDRPVVIVSEPALDLVNSFLDQILYNLLALSKSTSLSALRVAVPKLLKPRLGQAALIAAEEEVRDILEASDFEENTRVPKIKPSDFDLELVWKLARLRCMVYCKLGDMEEEDEEELLEQENLSEEALNRKVSTIPIEALFLAAIVGFLAEQALCAAAQHAEKRQNARAVSRHNEESAGEAEDDVEEEDDLVLESGDMLQLSREGPLSRLWRSWRRDSRSVDALPSRPASQSNAGESSHVRNASHTARETPIPEEDPAGADSPSQIPLPMRDSDVDEIEVPGLAPPLEGEPGEDLEVPERSARRPSSMLFMPMKVPPTPPSPTDQTTVVGNAPRPKPVRARSHSVPTPTQTSFISRQRQPNRDTVIFDPRAVSTVNDTMEGQTAKEREATSNDDSQEHEDGKVEDETPVRKNGGSRQSIISGTVAAIAGALGVEAMKASRMNKEQQDQMFKSAEQRDQPKKTRTVAEEILGPSNNVRPPSDAQTGASITGPSDFDSMHIPIDGTSDDGTDEERSSDPEDLALSSADEDTTQAQEHGTARDSGFAVAAPVETQPEPVQQRTVAVSPPSSPSSPKRVKREAAVYDNSMMEMRSAEDDDMQDNIPRFTDSEAPPVQPIRDEGNSVSPVISRAGCRDSEELPPQEQASVAAGHAQRVSSMEYSNSGAAAAVPRPADYSHHSRGSGSDGSGRVFVYGKDPTSRPPKLHQQRATFGEASQANGPKEQKLSSSSGSGSLVSRRGRLHINTDDDVMTDEQKKKSLEILIKSDETLHYTLTPQSARATEFSPADLRPKTDTQDLADFIRNTAPPGDQYAQQQGTRASMNGLRFNPPATTAVPLPVSTSNPPSMPLQQRSTVGGPRDARPERNTTRDLADYVRSTGPTNERQLAQALGTRPATGGATTRGGVRADGVPVAPTTSADAERSKSVSDRPLNRLKFQARDARPARNAETAELIDFIREGPPRTAGDHRIDRRVAPFRTTMDSDDLNALAPPPEANGRGSTHSQTESAVTAKSMQESTNSRTALLESTNRVNGAHPVSNNIPRKMMESNGMPPRTRRKVRDPYAIDDSDDELLEEEVPKPKPRNQEESLIDFLRNTAPPPGMAPQPILAAVPQTQEKAGIKRSASNSKLRDVLNRQASVPNKAGQKMNGNSNAREVSPHLTQVGSKIDKYRPTQTTHAAHVERNRMRKAEARDPTMSGSGGTGDLAAFLKSSGPPESPKMQGQRGLGDAKGEAGFLKFFSRRASVKR